MIGLVPAIVLAAATVMLVLRQRPRMWLTTAEASAILVFAVLGTLQGAIDHQVHFDGGIFPSVYVALVVFLGARAGVLSGFVGASLGLNALLVVSLSHPLGDAGVQVAGHILPHEWVTAWIAMVAVGAAAGALARRWPHAPPWSALLWLVFPIGQQPDLLFSPSTWGVVGGAFALSALGLWAIPPDALGARPAEEVSHATG